MNMARRITDALKNMKTALCTVIAVTALFGFALSAEAAVYTNLQEIPYTEGTTSCSVPASTPCPTSTGFLVKCPVGQLAVQPDEAQFVGGDTISSGNSGHYSIGVPKVGNLKCADYAVEIPDPFTNLQEISYTQGSTSCGVGSGQLCPTATGFLVTCPAGQLAVQPDEVQFIGGPYISTGDSGQYTLGVPTAGTFKCADYAVEALALGAPYREHIVPYFQHSTSCGVNSSTPCPDFTVGMTYCPEGTLVWQTDDMQLVGGPFIGTGSSSLYTNGVATSGTMRCTAWDDIAPLSTAPIDEGESSSDLNFPFSWSSSDVPSKIKAHELCVSSDGINCDDTVTVDEHVLFTNCDKEGNTGPSQAQCDEEYGAGKVTVSGGIQTWTVPETGTYRIEAIGASGGRGYHYVGKPGKGSRMRGDFTLTAGEQLKILVGQRGGEYSHDGGGGGGTFVVKSDNTPLIIAGGGGGSSYNNSNNYGMGQDAVIGTSGTAGATGGSGGSSGGAGSTSGNAAPGAGFSGNSSGGSHGNHNGKSFLSGGNGGASAYNSGYAHGGFGGGAATHGGGWGGGGGGGYSGGGASSSSQYGGGGGGSYNIGTNQANEAGYNEGHGEVTITKMFVMDHIFSTCGKEGKDGPSQSQCDAAYGAGQVTVSGGIQTWTVPITGTYTIDVMGAAGADGDHNADLRYVTRGGLGGRMIGDFNLTAGEQLKILVGQMGTKGANTSYRPGGGGGGSFVTKTDNTPLIVAGGGGGGGNANYGQVAGAVGQAIEEGSINGGTGGSGGTTASYSGAGAGITGNGGVAHNTVAAKSFVNGGTGGYATSHSTTSHGGFGGGGGGELLPGGGGGYSGGGVDGTWSGSGSAGGGGSYNNGTNKTNYSGVNFGHGRVRITLKEEKTYVWTNGSWGIPYFAKVRPIDISGNKGSWSEWSSGVVADATPPEVYAINYQANRTAEQTARFYVIAYDEHAGLSTTKSKFYLKDASSGSWDKINGETLTLGGACAGTNNPVPSCLSGKSYYYYDWVVTDSVDDVATYAAYADVWDNAVSSTPISNSNVGFTVLNAAPVNSQVTINTAPFVADNSTTYTITQVIRDSDGWNHSTGGFDGAQVIVNRGGTERGRFGWDNNAHLWSKNQFTCSGNGGFASQVPTGNGTDYVDLVGCNTVASSKQLTINYSIRISKSYGDVQNNDISSYVSDLKGVVVGWQNFDLNFDILPTPASNLALSYPYDITDSRSFGKITLNWVDNSGSTETGFRIERSENGSSWSTLTNVAAGTQTFTDTGLVGNKRYYYRIFAYNSQTSAVTAPNADLYTVANTPLAPTISIPAGATDTDSLILNNVGENGNSSITEYAMVVDSDDDLTSFNMSGFIKADGTMVSGCLFGSASFGTCNLAGLVWQTNAQWQNTDVSGLSPNTRNRLRALARNANGLQTLWGGESVKDTRAFPPATSVVLFPEEPVDLELHRTNSKKVTFTIDGQTNPASTNYAVYIDVDGNNTAFDSGYYLAADGSNNGATPVWQQKATWEALELNGFSMNQRIFLRGISRNNNDLVSFTGGTDSKYTRADIPLAARVASPSYERVDDIDSSAITVMQSGENPRLGGGQYIGIFGTSLEPGGAPASGNIGLGNDTLYQVKVSNITQGIDYYLQKVSNGTDGDGNSAPGYVYFTLATGDPNSNYWYPQADFTNSNFAGADFDGMMPHIYEVYVRAKNGDNLVTSWGAKARSELDRDGDGMADWYEVENGLNPSDPADRNMDADGDLVTNYDEFRNDPATDPQDFTSVGYNPSGLVGTALSNGMIYWTWVKGNIEPSQWELVDENGTVVASSTTASYLEVGLSAKTTYQRSVREHYSNATFDTALVSVTTPASSELGGGGGSDYEAQNADIVADKSSGSWYNDNQINFTSADLDAGNIDNYQYIWNQSETITETDLDACDEGTAWTTGTLTETLAAGSNYLHAIVCQANVPTVAGIVRFGPYNYDATAPVVGLLQLANGEAYTDTTSVNGLVIATDVGGAQVDQMQFVIDGGAATEYEDYLPMKLFTLTEGAHTVRVQVKDAAGNESGWTADENITVDTTAVTVGSIGVKTTAAGEAIAEDTWWTDNKVYIEWPSPTVGASGVAGYSLIVKQVTNPADDNSFTPDDVVDTVETNYEYIVPLADGRYVFKIKAQNNAGAWSAVESFVFKVDSTSPSVISSFPIDGASYNAADWTAASDALTGTSIDALSGLQDIEYTLQEVGGNYYNGTDFSVATETWNTPGGTAASWNVPMTIPSDGDYELKLKVRDNSIVTAGTYSETVETINFSVDTSAPSTPSISPSTEIAIDGGARSGVQATMTGEFSPTITTEANAKVFVKVNGAASYTEYQADSEGKYVISPAVPVTQLEPTIDFYVEDAAGNTSSTVVAYYAYTASLDNMTPTTAARGSTITLTGQNLRGGSNPTVTFTGAASATSIDSYTDNGDSTETITVTVPADAESGGVKVNSTALAGLESNELYLTIVKDPQSIVVAPVGNDTMSVGELKVFAAYAKDEDSATVPGIGYIWHFDGVEGELRGTELDGTTYTQTLDGSAATTSAVNSVVSLTATGAGIGTIYVTLDAPYTGVASAPSPAKVLTVYDQTASSGSTIACSDDEGSIRIDFTSTGTDAPLGIDTTETTAVYQTIETYTTVTPNVKINNYVNAGDVVSEDLYAGNANINSVILTKNDTVEGTSDVTYYVASDGDDANSANWTWEEVTPGQTHIFASPGKGIRWKATMTGSDVKLHWVTLNMSQTSTVETKDLPDGEYVYAEANCDSSTYQIGTLEELASENFSAKVQGNYAITGDVNNYSDPGPIGIYEGEINPDLLEKYLKIE